MLDHDQDSGPADALGGSARLGLCSFCHARTGRGTRDYVLEPFDLRFTVDSDTTMRLPMTEPRSWRACARCVLLLDDGPDLWGLAKRTRAGEKRLGCRSALTLAEHAAAFGQLVDHLTVA